MQLLIDENMPRSLCDELRALGFVVEDVRDIGLRGLPDEEVFRVATLTDAIIVTRDRGFTIERNWPHDFTAGVIFVNLSDDLSAKLINAKVITLLAKRLPVSLLGSITFLESQRALSRVLRRRSKNKPVVAARENSSTKENPNQGNDDETFDAQLDETRTD